MPITEADLKLQFLRGQLDSEIEAITGKFPWYEQILIVSALSVVIIGGSIACGFITVGSLGSATIPCVLALIALTTLLITLIIKHNGAADEADALELTAQQMEELVAEMEAD